VTTIYLFGNAKGKRWWTEQDPEKVPPPEKGGPWFDLGKVVGVWTAKP
jgi:hypothetical protein